MLEQQMKVIADFASKIYCHGNHPGPIQKEGQSIIYDQIPTT